MPHLLRLADLIDAVSRRIGQATAWLTLVMVLLGAFNALARYGGRFLGLELSSNAYIELQWYMFGVLFLLGAAETLREDGHVRVDVLYARFSPRTRHAVDLLGALGLLLPFCVLGFLSALPSVQSSWSVMEMSPDPGGLPRYPIKTLVPISFALLFAQGIARALRDAAALLGAQTADEASHG